MKRTGRILVALVGITSCACASTAEIEAHRHALAAWERVEIARAEANARRYEALMEVARRGDTTAQVAVAMAVNGGGGVALSAPNPMPATPDAEARAFKWAAIILPTATTLSAGYFGYKLGVSQSNNSARMTEASYGAIRDLGRDSVAATRDVAVGGFGALGALPHGTFLTINGNGNAAAIGGSATLDNSRRCGPSFGLSGIAGAGGAGGAGGAAPGGVGGVGGAAPTFTLPFNC